MHSGLLRCDFFVLVLNQTSPPSPSGFFVHRSCSVVSTFFSSFAGVAGGVGGGGGCFWAAALGSTGGGGGFLAVSLGSSHVDCSLQRGQEEAAQRMFKRLLVCRYPPKRGVQQSRPFPRPKCASRGACPYIIGRQHTLMAGGERRRRLSGVMDTKYVHGKAHT